MSQEWIEWNGGECPVPPRTIVEIKTNGGAVYETLASSLSWAHSDMYPLMNIVAYRIVEPVGNPDKLDAPESLRDRFAMAALTGLCGNQRVGNISSELLASIFEIADAMMEARKK